MYDISRWDLTSINRTEVNQSYYSYRIEQLWKIGTYILRLIIFSFIITKNMRMV